MGYCQMKIGLSDNGDHGDSSASDLRAATKVSGLCKFVFPRRNARNCDVDDSGGDNSTPGKKARKEWKESFEDICDHYNLNEKLADNEEICGQLNDYDALVKSTKISSEERVQLKCHGSENPEGKADSENLRAIGMALVEKLGPLVSDTGDNEETVSQKVKILLRHINPNLRWRKLGP